jgi:hypothetical protein
MKASADSVAPTYMSRTAFRIDEGGWIRGPGSPSGNGGGAGIEGYAGGWLS